MGVESFVPDEREMLLRCWEVIACIHEHDEDTVREGRLKMRGREAATDK